MSLHGDRHCRRILATAVLLLAGAARIGAGTDSPPPLPARIVLRSGQAWDVELLGRFFPDRVLLRRLEGSALIELPVADMARLDARLEFDLDPIAELYAAEDFEEAAARLAEGLSPFRPYVTDAAGNLEGAFRTLLLAHYWAGQYEQAQALADHVLGKTAASRLHRDAARIRALCRAATGTEEIPIEATDPPPSPDQPEASLHFYTQAILAMQQEAWDTAQEALARLITFRSRDFEWMPAALYQSAILHARLDQVPVARQIVEEIALVYPATRWAEQARSLDLEALRPPPPPPPPEHPLRRR